MPRIVKRPTRRAAFYDRQTLRFLRVSGVLREIVAAGVAVHRVIASDPSSPLSLPDQAKQIAQDLNRSLVLDVRLRPWNETSPALKGPYCSLVLAQDGPAYMTTLCLGPARRRLAHASRRGFLTHVTDEIRRRLRDALHRDVEFWFIVEKPPKGNEHLHGVMGVAEHELERATRALIHVAGDYYPPRAVRFQPLVRALGAGGYGAKDIDFTDLIMRGSTFMRTRELGQRAEQLYEFHRLVHRELVRMRRGGPAPDITPHSARRLHEEWRTSDHPDFGTW